MVKRIILFIDDDVLILNALKERFNLFGIEVYTAKDDREALEVMNRITPEVIILDLLLTREEGSQIILDFLKSQERLQHVPVLVLTNLDQPELKQKVLTQGVKEYIIKGSTNLDEIYKKVISYLEPQINISSS